MKNILITMAACLLLAGWNATGYCQEESSIEQSESSAGQELESNISSDQSQDQAEVGQMETSMESGGQQQ